MLIVPPVTVQVTAVSVLPVTVAANCCVALTCRVAAVGFIFTEMAGGAETVKVILLLAWPPTVTTTLPVVAPLGTVAAMLVALQLVTLAAVPLKVTVLLPWLVPKFVPVIVTAVPTGPELGARAVMLGELDPPPPPVEAFGHQTQTFALGFAA